MAARVKQAPARPSRREAGGASAAPALDAFLASLVSERVLYFPIRHHSPACARHL